INYTGEGGRIDISMEVTEYDVHIYISDTGIGIPEESVPRVFERFYRVDKARSINSGGTGHGLATVKHLVHYHHGEIKDESIEGRDRIRCSYIYKRHRYRHPGRKCPPGFRTFLQSG